MLKSILFLLVLINFSLLERKEVETTLKIEDFDIKRFYIYNKHTLEEIKIPDYLHSLTHYPIIKIKDNELYLINYNTGNRRDYVYTNGKWKRKITKEEIKERKEKVKKDGMFLIGVSGMVVSALIVVPIKFVFNKFKK